MQKIIGVGCDLIDIQRVKSACEKSPAFLSKILLPSEIAYCQKYKDPFSRIAARFSAKEAVSKALGSGIGEKLGFHDIEIRHNSDNKPVVILSDNAKKRFPGINLEISLSHTDHQAMAYVVAFI